MRITLSSNTKLFLDSLNPSKTEEKYYLKIMEIMYGKICREHNDLDEFMQIPMSYWRKSVGSHYQKYLKLLVKSGCIEVDNSYSTKKHTSKSYRINQKLAYSSPILVKFANRSRKLHDTKDSIVKHTIKNLQRIKTTYRTDSEMAKLAQEDINYQYLVDKGLKVGTIPKGKFAVYGYSKQKKQNIALKSYPIESNKIWFIAQEMDLKPVFWKNRIYLTDNLVQWVEKKIIDIQHHYLDALKNFRYIRNRKNVICVRNETNLRLDTNLTNAPSKILKYLRLDGEQLYNADVKNSQLAFFSRSSFFLNRLYKYEKLVEEYPIIREGLEETIEKDKGLQIIIRNIEYLLSRGICHSIIIKKGVLSELLALSSDCQSDNYGIFHKKNASGKTYEFLASKLYESRYKGVFSNCPSMKDLQNRIKYSTDIISEKEGVLMPYRKLKPNLITFSKPLSHYKSEFKAIRADVKLLVFQTIFSSYRFNNELKTMLKKEFSGVIGFMDGFKKLMIKYYKETGLESKKAQKMGNASFSILLQLIESSVIIDGIYKECLDRGVIVFTKHDSVLFKPSDYVKVMGIIRKHLNQFFGRNNFNLKIEQ